MGYVLLAAVAISAAWPRPAGIDARKMIPITIENRLAGWACIGVSRVNRSGPEGRVPSLEGNSLTDLLRSWGYGQRRNAMLISRLREIPEWREIRFLLLYTNDVLPTFFAAGDYSPDSEANLATLKINVGRIEFK